MSLEELYESFKRVLKPPEHTPEMGKAIQYTRKQSELVKSKASLRQKVRGVAGCGKTKVLAGKDSGHTKSIQTHAV